MTDERPAEPDTSGVLRLVAEYARARGCVISWTAENERRAVEAAVRDCAIEYAESRVRAMTCYRNFCSGLGPNEADGDRDFSEYCSKPGYRACPYHAELAALARLKGGEG